MFPHPALLDRLTAAGWQLVTPSRVDRWLHRYTHGRPFRARKPWAGMSLSPVDVGLDEARWLLRRWELARPTDTPDRPEFVVIYSGALSPRILAGGIVAPNGASTRPTHLDPVITYTTNAALLAELVVDPPRTHDDARDRATKLRLERKHGEVWTNAPLPPLNIRIVGPAERRASP